MTLAQSAPFLGENLRWPRKGQSECSWLGGFGLELVGFRWFGGRSLFEFVDRFVSFVLYNSQVVAIVLKNV